MSVAFSQNEDDIEDEQPMNKKVFAEIQKRGHEQVTFFHDPEVGLRAIVAIHNTVLGPSLGGCRMRLYDNEDEAIDDALRLAEGMTYKSSVAGLNLGGGKSCILADPNMKGEERTKLFAKFGQCLNDLAGRYITAEDMGTSVEDVMVMREHTKYAAGFAQDQGGGGDPSPWTALGVFGGIRAACERRYGGKDLTGKHIVVQGAGHVGEYLIEHLVKAGARVTVSDTNDFKVQNMRKKFDVEIASVDAIYDVDCDVYSPCAVGQTVNRKTLPRLKCDIISGGANNQLMDEGVYDLIQSRGMLYVPDFVVNAGGIISVAGEYEEGGWSRDWVMGKVNDIYDTVHTVLEQSEVRGKFPEIVAIELAKERIAQVHAE